MSRIGKKPVTIPSGIEVKINGSEIIVKKGKEQKSLETHGRVKVELKNNRVYFNRLDETKRSSAYWGTYRALLNNIIVGFDKGFKKSLEINGVGYRAIVSGNILELQLGYSHPIKYDIPKGIDIKIEKNIIHISGTDKQQGGQSAALLGI